MSVNVGQIFIRVPDRQALIAGIQKYLQLYANKVGLADKTLVGKDGARRLLLTPPVRGWSAVLEENHRETDLPLAAVISSMFKARTVALKVEGCVFNYKWALFESGEQRQGEVLLTPDDEQSPALPLFKDAEVLAWEQAVKLNLPTELLFMRAQDFTTADDTLLEPGMLFQLSKEGEAFRLQIFEHPIRIPLQPVQPRSQADTVVADQTGKPLMVVESRFVWGKPDQKSLEHLSMLLRRIQHRYSRAMSLPNSSISFQVYSSGVPLQLPEDLAGAAMQMESSPPKPNPRRKNFE